MLRNVQFNYPHLSVSDVTQNSFHNYFGGSEIVVAGKYTPERLEQLQSIVTATSVLLLISLFLKILTGPPDTMHLVNEQVNILHSENVACGIKAIKWKGTHENIYALVPKPFCILPFSSQSQSQTLDVCTYFLFCILLNYFAFPLKFHSALIHSQ